MHRVVSFYEKLPRGPAPEIKATGLFRRYQARYFGKNPSAARMLPTTRAANVPEISFELTAPSIALAHVIGALLLIGYCNDYYFHLRKYCIYPANTSTVTTDSKQVTTRTMRTRDFKVRVGSAKMYIQ